MINNLPKHIDERISFVAKHYKPNAFDSRKGWERIQKQIAPGQKALKMYRLYGSAAAVILLLVASVFFYNLNSGEKLIVKADNTLFVLPDASRIEMQKGAQLKYDKDFGKKNRRLTMSGKVSFDVERNEEIPFIVTTPSAEIQVLGTEFIVDENDQGTRLEVISGKVSFTANDPLIPIVCTAGMHASYVAENKEITVISGESRTLINGTENSLTFNNISLQNVSQILSSYYNTHIIVAENEQQIQLTSSFKQKNIQEIIQIINLTLDTDVKIQD